MATIRRVLFITVALQVFCCSYLSGGPSIIVCAADTAPVKQCCPCCLEELPDLSLGAPPSMKPLILEIQEALKQAGYYRGDCNGVFDEKTAQAVRSFQKKTGLAPDGVVRYHVWLKLAAELEKLAVSSELPPPPGEVALLIDTFRRKLVVFSDGVPYAQFPVAIGKSETPSPIGNWTVVSKATGWGTGFGTRWLGLSVPWGKYGIHGTNRPWSIGTMSSHGCFRMRNADIELIFTWIKPGTNVVVVGNPFGYMSGGIQRLNRGDNGAAVRYVQEKMRRRGYFAHEPDGMFGRLSEQAVLQLQKKYGLEQTGQLGTKEYEVLGLW